MRDIIKYKKYQKYYRKIHKKEVQKYNKDYYSKHKNNLLINMKKYQKIYQLINKQKIADKKKLYYQTHKKEILKYQIKQRKININFRIVHNLRKRIWDALKGICKSKSTIKLLGCSIEQLKIHLESKFIKDMSWKNYGSWHVDHIRPCSSFDLSKPEEQRKCFHYMNLQPL